MRMAEQAMRTGLAAVLAALTAGAATAQTALETVGKPVPMGTGFQPAATELARDIQFLDGFLLVIMAAIVIFVVGLMGIVVFRFNAKANPTPKTFTHNSAVEVTWTVVPILILIVIGAVSLPILFKQLEIPESDITIKVTGRQWYWSYEYPEEEVAFDSLMLAREDLAAAGYADDEYLLATDTAVVVPVDAVVRLQITGADVIHSWAMPAFGVKMDAVPGRLQETWFKADRPGVYFGQCSELCGMNHAYMPIVVKVLPQPEYDAWLAEAKVASAPADGRVQVAQN